MQRIETPGSYGPWTASASESGETIWIGNDSENAGCVPGYTDHPQNIANANLMAAAPELLVACQMLEDAEDKRQHCEECEGEGEPEACGTCFPFFDDARIARRLAIAKATSPTLNQEVEPKAQ